MCNGMKQWGVGWYSKFSFYSKFIGEGPDEHWRKKVMLAVMIFLLPTEISLHWHSPGNRGGWGTRWGA